MASLRWGAWLEVLRGFIIIGHHLNDIRHVVDTVFMADTAIKMQEMLEKAVKKTENEGLTIKYKKTECMVIRNSNSSTFECYYVTRWPKIENLLGYLLLRSMRKQYTGQNWLCSSGCCKFSLKSCFRILENANPRQKLKQAVWVNYMCVAIGRCRHFRLWQLWLVFELW